MQFDLDLVPVGSYGDSPVRIQGLLGLIECISKCLQCDFEIAPKVVVGGGTEGAPGGAARSPNEPMRGAAGTPRGWGWRRRERE